MKNVEIKNKKLPATSISKWILLTLAFIQHSPASADVNMKDGSFVTTRIDLRISGPGPVFFLSRTYNSQSVRRGAFGFGWSSDLESVLKPRANGVQKVKWGPWNLHVHFDPRARLQMIQSGKTRLRYVYKGDVLVKVFEQDREVASYEYDLLQNLTFKKEGGQNERIVYDPDHDRVIAHRAQNGCREKFEYSLEGPLQSETRMERSCPGQPTKRLRSHFHYSRRADGQTVLDKTEISSGEKRRQILYDTQTGLVLRLGLNQNKQGEAQ